MANPLRVSCWTVSVHAHCPLRYVLPVKCVGACQFSYSVKVSRQCPVIVDRGVCAVQPSRLHEPRPYSDDRCEWSPPRSADSDIKSSRMRVDEWMDLSFSDEESVISL